MDGAANKAGAVISAMAKPNVSLRSMGILQGS